MNNRVNQRLNYAILATGIAGLALSSLSYAEAPLAGTNIGNQASATYTDDSGATRTSTSNTVITVVQQVAAFTLTQNNTRNVPPGGTVYFPHTVTNNGNGTDSFDLSAVLASGNLTNIFIYADADNNGIPDNFTPIVSTGDIAAGGSFNFVIAATVPGSQTAPHTATLTVSATSDFSQTPAGAPVQTKTNTDTALVVADAVMIVTKSISQSSGAPGTTPITYTLTYTNIGNNTATDFTLTDVVPDNNGTTPAELLYISGSARWSVTGPGTPLTDATLDTQGTAPNTIDYSFDAGNRTLTAIISQVLPGQSGSLTFQVSVNTGVPPQIINNVANYSYDPDGSGSNPPTTPTPTNSVPFTITQVAGVVADDPTGVTLDSDNLVEVPSANAGATVTFTNRIVNTGNGIDTFDMTFVSNNFPSGTTFQFFKSDGNTPLVDTNSNGTPDTGPLAPGATYNVIVKAFLPNNATAAGAPFDVVKRATSGFNPAIFDDVTDRLNTIVGKSVDLTNNTARSDSTPAGTANVGNASSTGFGFESGDNLATATVTNNANPGTTTRFTLYVNNTSDTADTYQLQADADGNFGTISLYPGWSVVFRNSSEAVITNTGSIDSGKNVLVYADVTIPAFETPGIRDIYFQVSSISSGAVDRKRDAVNVNTVRDLGLVSDNAGQVFPGGSVVYAHLLTNLGNVIEGNGSPSVITLGLTDSLAAQGWNSVVYWDKNGDGQLDSADPVVSVLDGSVAGWNGLDPNETQRFFVKVFAPLQADALTVDVTTLTATTSGGPINGVGVPAVETNKDTTTVIKGDVVLLKEQALDTDNNGVADGTYTTLNLQAKPGQSIVYRITVTNSGNTDADSIVIYDTTPVSTTYLGVGPDGTASVTGGSAPSVTTAPAPGATGNFVFNVGTLTPGASAVIKFGVKIDPLSNP